MEYQPLKQEQSEIRLVTVLPVQPGSDATVIHCDLRHVSLMRPPTYTALSYCWGDANVTREIFVNGNSFLVTTNLYLALTRLRGTIFNTLWIDAICIHQKDLVEKSMQLLLMGSIYRKASTTVSWLGDPETQQIDLLHENIISLKPESFSKREFIKSIPDLVVEEVPVEYLPRVPISVLRNPYWHRVWVIQELALSEEILFWWPKGSMELHHLEAEIKLQKKRYRQGLRDENMDNVDQIQRVLQFRSNLVSERPVPFFGALALSHASLATEARDKAFALLNVSFNGDRYIPVPNYSQSIQDLCLDITTAGVKASKSLDMLVLFANEGDISWPSWQPNWLSLSTAGGNVERKMHYLLRRMLWPKDLDFQNRQEIWDFKNACEAWTTPVSFPYTNGTTVHIKGVLIPKSKISVLSSDINGSPGSVSASELQNTEQQIPPAYGGGFSNNTLFKRLFFTLCILGGVCFESRGTQDVIKYSDADILQNLWPGVGYQNRKKYPKLFEWIEENQHLPLWGYTLGYWLQCRALGGLKKTLRLFISWIDEQNLEFFGEFFNEGEGSQNMPYYLEASLEWGMRFAVTEDGHIGWVDARSQIGDRIVILRGCTFPVVLRRRDEGGWRIVGWCFIHGYMNEQLSYDFGSSFEVLEIH